MMGIRASRGMSDKPSSLLARNSRHRFDRCQLDCKGVQNTLQNNACNVSTSTSLSFTQAKRSITSTKVSDRYSFAEKCYSKSKGRRPAEAGILFSPFSSPKMEWRLPPSIRRFEVESIPSLPTFPDGNGEACTPCSKTRRLGFQPRSFGCLPTCTNSTSLPEIPASGTIERGGVLFQSPSLWFEYESSSVHKDRDSSRCPSSKEGSSNAFIPRRLALSKRRSRSSPSVYTCHTENNQESRLSDKSSEIQSETCSNLSISRPVVRYPHCEGKAGRPLSRKDNQTVNRSPVDGNNHTKANSSTSRSLQCSSRFPRIRSTFSSPCTTLAEKSLGSEQRKSRFKSSSYFGSSPGGSQMDRSRLAVKRSSFMPSPTYSDPLHGCIPGRMGSKYRRLSCVRPLVSRGVKRAYKCFRNESYSKCISNIERSNSSPGSLASNRQLYLRQLHQEIGRHSLSDIVPTDLGTFSVDPEHGHKDPVQTHSIQTQCSSRQSFEVSSFTNRMVSEQTGFQRSQTPGSKSVNRPLRNLHKPSVGGLHKSLSRSESDFDRCPVQSLGLGRHSVCFSSTSDVTSSVKKDNFRSSTSDSVNSSLLASSVLVHRPADIVGDKCVNSANTQGLAFSRPLDTPEPSVIQTSRLDVIRHLLTSEGYTEAIAQRVAQAGRQSTTSIYDSKWRIYSDWCSKQSLNSFHRDGPQLARFFCHLFEDKGLSYSTLRGYKASILSVLDKLGGLSKKTDHILGNLFQSFQKERPVRPVPMPEWDLGIVLQGLKVPPFEPIKKASLDLITKKTLFLLALATGARRGELLALRRGKFVQFTEGFEEVLLYPDPIFIPKTKRGVSSTKPIVVRSFKNLVGIDSVDRFLCPIRALKVYLHKSNKPSILRERKKLFLPLNKTSNQEITTVGIKNLLLSAIQEAYRAVDPKLGSNFDLRVHDLRMLSHSLAKASGVSIENILTSGRWKSKSTFTNFYLKSLAVYAENIFSLGPISVAGSVVQPGCKPLTC